MTFLRVSIFNIKFPTVNYDEIFEANRKHWNQRVPVHFQSDFYNVEGFKKGQSSLTEIEREALGDVSGKSLLHLQCHFGMDTMSWARKGAVVTGVDFAPEAIATAKKLSEELDIPARFLEANVYDLPEILDEKFDIVFSTFGTIVWLPDLVKWAAMVSKFLKPGGVFYLAEFHPTFYLFDFDNGKVSYDYFNSRMYKEEIERSYAGSDETIEGVEYFWNHDLSEVISALLGEGLQLLEFKEFPFSPYNCFPNMEERSPGRYVWTLPGHEIPHVYSLKMVRPSS
ncbi:MAG: class I SAM-dependent methyltransferase [Saprospiraceae bacterium]